MQTLTVFTPTYNRAYTLKKCYESLTRQTSQDFKWLIIDDGSNDNTEDLIQSWIKENKIEIKYVYQKNAGMHAAHNTAHKLIKTELCVCCDSDDYLADEAVRKIVSTWKNKGGNKHSGIIGLDANPNDEINAELPPKLKETTLYDLRYKYKIRGDFKLVYRTDLMKKEYYPINSGENYLPIGYKYFKIDKDFKMITLDEILCYVEYLPDGGTNNKMKLYEKAPKGFAHYRKEVMKVAPDFSVRLREAIHYVSSSILSKNKRYIHESPKKLETVLATPAGLALFIYIKCRNKSKEKYE
ncbi:glycosyltransferase family A protein [uncultured Marinococcus sp.]|uniref:glycosyltransferase family A protein n=1 Tax=uncultured Marinococcus sp. TaxID=487012 RepID=UPI00262F907C|nr:glycosyltransferase family 2 protein [uncultured Marinococcus sp.]